MHIVTSHWSLIFIYWINIFFVRIHVGLHRIHIWNEKPHHRKFTFSRNTRKLKGNQWTSGRWWAHPCREIMLWINNNKYCKRSFLLKMSLDGLAASWATANTTPDGGQKVMVRNSMVILEKLVVFWTMSPKFVCSPSM